MCKRNCLYAGGVNYDYGDQHTCDYSTVTARTAQELKTRSGQLWKKVKQKHPDWNRKKQKKWVMKYLDPENCPFFESIEPGMRIDRTPQPIVPRKKPNIPKKEYKPPVSEDLLRSWYKRGLSDKKIADKLCLSEWQVRKWRLERGIVSNGIKNHNRIDEAKALKLYEQGMNDQEIAENVGCSAVAICNWRKRRKLQRRTYRRMDEDLALRLYSEGLNDREISRGVGCSVDAVQHWRQRNRLESNWTKAKRKGR